MSEDCRLLVVDDEAVIRRILIRALLAQGFLVEEAEDGAVAAELIRSSSKPFDLLIADIVMPGMDGMELAELTRQTSPSTRILLISAYVPSPRPSGVEELPFLQKPFKLDLFLTTVRELLSSATPTQSFPIIVQ